MVFPIKGFGQFGGCGPEGRWPNQMCSYKLTADPAKPVVIASSGRKKRQLNTFIKQHGTWRSHHHRLGRANAPKLVVIAASGREEVSDKQQFSVLACGLVTSIISTDSSWRMQLYSGMCVIYTCLVILG